MASKQLTLSQCIEGMLFYKRASGKSPRTIADYRNGFTKLQPFLADHPPLASITRDQLIAFFACLHDDHVSESGGPIPCPPIYLSAKTIRNIPSIRQN